MNASQRISKARTELLLDFPWFGSLAMNLCMKECKDIDTFDVDGTTMRYNPDFAMSLNDKELVGVVAHEVMHCALLHIFRRENRDPYLWNVAADYAINIELIDSGLTLPQGALLDTKYKGLAAEVIYSQLKQQAPQPKSGQGQGKQGQGSPCPTGKFSDAPQDNQGQQNGQGKQGNGKTKGQQPKQQAMSEQDWKIAAEQAAKVAKAAGKFSGSLERILENSRQSKIDWRSELKEFLEQTVPSDYSWCSPNRRYIHQGIYLPGTVKEGFGTLAIACDTSGSINAEALNAFASEISAIASELKPEKIVVMFADAEVKNVQTFDAGDDITLTPKGGGGTMFQPVLDAINKWDEPPKVLVWFTDLYCFDQPTEPTYPTMFVTDLGNTKQPPFGRVLRIEA